MRELDQAKIKCSIPNILIFIVDVVEANQNLNSFNKNDNHRQHQFRAHN